VTRKVEKPCGRELWIAHVDRYVLKRIELKSNYRPSLQYHVEKHEDIYVDAGTLQMQRESDQSQMETLLLKPDDVKENRRGCKHQVQLLEDVQMIEVSTPKHRHRPYGRAIVVTVMAGIRAELPFRYRSH
jgi:mannose-6-phosphate isomerase